MADDTQKSVFLEGLGRNFTPCLDGLLDGVTVSAAGRPSPLSVHSSYFVQVPYQEGVVHIGAFYAPPKLPSWLGGEGMYEAEVTIFKQGGWEQWTPPSPQMIFIILGNRYHQQEQRRETAKNLQGGIV